MFHHSEDLVMLFATLYVLQKANVPLDTLQVGDMAVLHIHAFVRVPSPPL